VGNSRKMGKSRNCPKSAKKCIFSRFFSEVHGTLFFKTVEKLTESGRATFEGQPHPAPSSFFRPPLVNQPLIRRPTIAGDCQEFSFLGDRNLYKLLAHVMFYGLVTFTVLR